ncbi:MAG: cytochrome c3 family protein [Ignavibacteriales bacterium]
MDDKGKLKNGWRERLLNKKTLIIMALVIIIVGAGAGVGFVKASDNPAFCTICHNMQLYYDSYHEGNLLAKKHADAGNVCHDCHKPDLATQADEGIKFVTGNYKTPLDKLEVSRDFCLECHTDFDTKVKAATNFEESNPHDSHNGEQECNLCHTMHGQSKPMCAECHQFEWFNDLDSSWDTNWQS